MKISTSLIAVMALVLWVSAEVPPNISPGSPWEGVSGRFQADYDGKNDQGLSWTSQVSPETYYALTWNMKASQEELRPVFTVNGEIGDYGSFSKSYPVSAAPNVYTFYFYSGSASSIPFKLFCRSSKPKKIDLSALELRKIEADAFKGNLMPEGYFHGASGIPVMWKPDDGTPQLPARIEKQADFLAGDQALLLKIAPQEKGVTSISSIQLPMIPGKRFEASFWGKADAEAVLALDVNGWSMYRHFGGHWWKSRSVKVGPAWAPYSLTVDIPEDFKAFPDLQSRLVSLKIRSKENAQTAKVWISAIRFRQVEKAD